MFRQTPIESASAGAWWTGRAWYTALAVSMVVHVGVIVSACALPATFRSPEDRSNTVESRWSPGEIPPAPEVFEPVVEISPATANSTGLESGGKGSAPEAAVLDSSSGISVAQRPPTFRWPAQANPSAAWFDEHWRREDLARVVGPVSSGPAKTSGSGNGSGNGTGDGTGSGGRFFEMRTDGRRFVFVVDRSHSMNHPYPGEYKTRLNRVKIEIGRTIAQMNAQAEFFIILFNDQAHPMPYQTFQPAQSAARTKSFQWLASVPADGLTDPRPALRMALDLRPDVIYFLTDGEFSPVISRDLEKIVQRGTAIHTFSLSNPHAEPTLKAVAEHNGGQYTFVP